MKFFTITLCSLFFVLGCGGNGSSPPVYNDNGVCLSNCPDNGGPDNGKDGNGADGKDGFVNDQSDVNGGDQPPDGSTDQTEVEPYVCPSEIPPLEQYEACMPKTAKEAFCKPTTKLCKFGFVEGQPCTTDSFCQQVPQDQWPPCVCWEVCVLAAHEWDCEGYTYTVSKMGEKNGYCLVSANVSGFYKPGNGQLYLQWPAEGEPEQSILISPDGMQITVSAGTGPHTCTRIE